jgi:hypothetical protein
MLEIVLHPGGRLTALPSCGGYASAGDAKSMIHMDSRRRADKSFAPPLKATARFVKLRLGGSPLPAFPP